MSLTGRLHEIVEEYKGSLDYICHIDTQIVDDAAVGADLLLNVEDVIGEKAAGECHWLQRLPSADMK